jgi:hypothetical protein
VLEASVASLPPSRDFLNQLVLGNTVGAGGSTLLGSAKVNLLDQPFLVLSAV